MLRIVRKRSLSLLAIGTVALAARGAQELDPEWVIASREGGAERAAQEQEKAPAATVENLERLRLDFVTGNRPALEILTDVEKLQESCDRELLEYKPEHSRGRLLAQLGSSIRLLRAEILLQLGRMDEAKVVLEEIVAADQKKVVESKEFARLAESVLRASAPDRTSEDVRAEVERALAEGNIPLVRELGSIAVPSLEAWIVANASDFPAKLDDDALWVLQELDLRRAGAFILEHYDMDGYLWRRRVARVLRASEALTHDEHWTGSEAPKTCLLPEWLQVLERLVEDPEFGAELMGKVLTIADNRGTSPRLQAALQASLAVGDAREGAFLDCVLQKRNRFGEDMRSVLETAVSDPDATVRQLAAARLLSYERSDALLSHWNDPDPQVRAVVVASFRPRQIYSGAAVLPPLTSESRELLASLVNDPDSRVRSEVLGVLVERASDGFDFALYQQLARDSDAAIRKNLARSIRNKLPLARCAELWVLLANDVDRGVVQSIDGQLDPGGWGGEVELMLPVLEARMQSKNHPWKRLNPDQAMWNRLAQLKNTIAGLDWLVRKGLEWNDEEMLRATSDVRPALLRLSPELVPAYVERLFELQTDSAIRQSEFVWNASTKDFPQREHVTRVLIDASASTTMDPRLRFLLASIDGRISGTRVADAAIATMTDARWRPGGPWTDPGWLEDVLDDRMESIANEEHNRILLSVLSHPDAAAEMQAAAAHYLLRPYAKNGVEAVSVVLDRWLDDTSTEHSSVDVAIRSLGTLPVHNRNEILRRVVRERRYVGAAASAMASTRDESFVPDLTAILLDPSTHDFGGALRAVGSFLTDGAAEALLDVSAQITDPDRRQAALAAVEEIRTYQEARERWSNRRLGKQTREQTTAELLTMLADSDARVRSEAAKGLATLGAIEAIPRLIRMLQDPAAEVREAADSALERLNRQAEAEAKTEGGV